jgi:RHS repeat-associated protein
MSIAVCRDASGFECGGRGACGVEPFKHLDVWAGMQQATRVVQRTVLVRRVVATAVVLSFTSTNVLAAMPQALRSAGSVKATTTSSVGPLSVPGYLASKVENPTATASAGTTPIGALGGGFSVDAMGGAHYGISLQPVQGVAGFQPSASLEYSSSASNGYLGLGFALRASSMIERCATTAATASDGKPRGVKLDKDDSFCLGGLKLVVANGGVYGKDGTEYRTLPDTHVKVTSFGGTPQDAGPMYFVVQLPNGVSQSYGRQANGQADTTAVMTSSGVKNTAWPLAYQKDGSGNTIHYDYVKRVQGSSEIERWLDRITYGNNIAPDRRVQFDYEDRPDKVFGYRFGVQSEMTKRLTRVRMEKSVNGWLMQARAYTFSYISETASGQSLLDQVQECGSVPSECKRPTKFGWQHGDAAYKDRAKQAMGLPSSADAQVLTLDANGDGRTDFVYPSETAWQYVISNAAPTLPNQHYGAPQEGLAIPSLGVKATAYAIDYNLDGRDDLMPRGPGVSKWRPHLWYAAESRFVRAETDRDGPLNQTQSGAGALFGDFNGDGLQDILEGRFFPDENRWRYWMRLRTGTSDHSLDINEAGVSPVGPVENDHHAFPDEQSATEIPLHDEPAKLWVTDIDGDGQDEILFAATVSGTTKRVVAISPTRPFTGPASQTDTGLTAAVMNFDVKFIDLNGDGLLDLVANGGPTDTAPGTMLYASINTGARSLPFAAPVPMGIHAPIAAFKAARVKDGSGDGRQRLFVPSLAQTSMTALDEIKANFGSTGAMSFAMKRLITFASPRLFANTDEMAKQGFRLVDADGDGLQDVLVFERGADSGVFLYKKAGKKPGLLESVRENYSAGEPDAPLTVEISYASVANPSVYERGDCIRLQWRNCKLGTITVVQQTREDVGLNASLNGPSGDTPSKFVADYRYKLGRVDRYSGRFVGFGEVFVTRSASHGSSGKIKTRSFYDNTRFGLDPILLDQWTYTDLPNANKGVQRTQLKWQKVANAHSYFEVNNESTYTNFEMTPFDPAFCGGQECLSTLSHDFLNAMNLPYFRKVTGKVTKLDLYGNITGYVTTFGDVRSDGSVDSTVVSVTPDYDLPAWLMRRPKAVVVTDTSLDTVAQTVRTRTHTTSYVYPPVAAGVNATLPRKIERFETESAPGKKLSFEYDYTSEGNLQRIKATDSVTAQVREATFAYDPHGYLHAQRIGLEGHTTYTGFDPVTGRLKVVLDPNGVGIDYTYDSLGRQVKVVGMQKPRGTGGVEARTAYTLQPFGGESLLQIETSDDSGAKAQVVMDRAGRTMIERRRGFDGLMRERQLHYNGDGRLVRNFVFGSQGASSTDRVSYEYDNWGRMLTQTEPGPASSGSATRRWSYDGLVTLYTDTRGNQKRSTRDQRGRLAEAIDALGVAGKEVKRVYGYDAFNHLGTTQLEGMANTRSRYTYDSFGNVESSHDAESGATGYEYNAFSELSTRTDASGRKATLAYDVLGRLSAKTVSNLQSGLPTRSLAYTYDSIHGEGARTTWGALLRSESVDHKAGGVRHVTDHVYDEFGRLSSTSHTLPSDLDPTLAETLLFSWQYDDLGRVKSKKFPRLPGQFKPTLVQYGYAPAATSNGRLQQIQAIEQLTQNGDFNATTLWKAQATDQQDRLSQYTLGSAQTFNTFDWAGRPASTLVIDSAPTGTPLAMLQFGYDTEGNLKSRSDDLQSAAEFFGYDEMNRVAALSMQNPDPFANPQDDFVYDKLGNLSSSKRRGTFTVDANKPTQVIEAKGGIIASGTRKYAYDVIGRQIARPGTTVEYNDCDLPAKLLSSVDKSTQAVFLYDASCSRTRRVTRAETVTYAPGYERHRAADGAVEYRLSSNGATLRYRQRGSTLDKLPTLYTQGDHLGSTALVTQNELESSGGVLTKVVEKRAYDVFGARRNPDWTSADVYGGLQKAALDQGFTSHVEDFELGTVHMNGRVYDPSLARFNSRDPHVDGFNATQRWNRYAYVGNNPLNATDPTGFRAHHATKPMPKHTGTTGQEGGSGTGNTGGGSSTVTYESTGGGTTPPEMPTPEADPDPYPRDDSDPFANPPGDGDNGGHSNQGGGSDGRGNGETEAERIKKNAAKSEWERYKQQNDRNLKAMHKYADELRKDIAKRKEEATRKNAEAQAREGQFGTGGAANGAGGGGGRGANGNMMGIAQAAPAAVPMLIPALLLGGVVFTYALGHKKEMEELGRKIQEAVSKLPQGKEGDDKVAEEIEKYLREKDKTFLDRLLDKFKPKQPPPAEPGSDEEPGGWTTGNE